ncbi:MAG TPA: XrtA system polysaccharide chain length determinant [Candidatus Sulfotelmatobacter sp.]|nr:XrtA system polysaccharide chain length determinant [Candidatus Sulfotelmatobacter sp.]
MVDDFDNKEPRGLDIKYLLGLVRRRHLHFLIPLFVGWAAVWTVSWILPPRYQSGTLILVEQPTMPKDYVTPNISDDLQERLQSITQQILSRTRLAHIIERYNLYDSPHRDASPDSKVDRMRKDIDIELVRDARNQITAFNVSYTSRNPLMAQQVTGEITNLFINENLEVRQQQSEDTTKFLVSQLETARKTLSEQEEKIRQFKAQHVGEMPGQLASNLQILSGLQSQLQNEEDALNAAKQQHVYLQTMADQYRTMQGPAKNGDGTSAGLPAIDQELDKLKSQLADLSSHYTERHPDVRKMKEQIARTEKIRAQLLASMKSQSENASGSENSTASTEAGDPAQTPMLAQVQSQLRSNQVEIANREHAIASLKAKVDDYQARLNQEPVREQQLADLTRGYDQSKANYDDLLKKKNESAMATSMELLQQGERFRIMDPPSFPQKPDFPNRLKFCGIGLAVGFALGVVVVGTFEMMDDRLYDDQDIKKLLPTEVIAEIPAIVTFSDTRMAKRKIWLGWATAAVVFTGILAGSAISYLRG